MTQIHNFDRAVILIPGGIGRGSTGKDFGREGAVGRRLDSTVCVGYLDEIVQEVHDSVHLRTAVTKRFYLTRKRADGRNSRLAECVENTGELQNRGMSCYVCGCVWK